MTEKQPHTPWMLRREDCLLTIIDVQEKLLPMIFQKERVLENVVRLLKFSRMANLPIILTEQEKLGATVPELRREIEDFRPISKICFDCFSCEEFEKRVNETGRKTLIVVGIEAHVCVTQTVLHALPDFSVHVVEDAVSSRTSENRSIGVERMRGRGATITSTEMAIFEMLQKAGTDEFRAALQLIK